MTLARLIVETFRWLTGLWLLWTVPTLGAPEDESAQAVAVIIPARDEQATLPVLLGSLRAQYPPPTELVVVDDHSTDATVQVAAGEGARVIAAPPLPEGWTGKAWACWQGAGATTAGTLVFLDADTRLTGTDSLATIVAEQHRRGGLLSVQPFHVTARPYEALSAFFNVVSMMGIDAFGLTGSRRTPRGAFGPCLVASRTDYLAAGGHGDPTVRGAVTEDVALARSFGRSGSKVTCLGGRGTIDFRMYPGGIAQLVEGWTKNFATGAGGTRPLTLALIVVWISGALSAAWYLAAAAAGAHGPLGIVAALAMYAAYAAQLWWMLRRIGRFAAATAPGFAVPLVFFVAVFARSVALTALRGEVRWRGRTLSTRRPS